MKADPFIHQVLIDGAAPKLFDIEERVVACFDYSHGLLFTGTEWRIATAALIRKARLNGHPMGSNTFKEEFPLAASTAVPMWLVLQAMDQPLVSQTGSMP